MSYPVYIRGLACGLGLAILSLTANAQINPKISGVIETYFLANPANRGLHQTLTWAEVRARITPNWSATWSGFDASSFAGYDEAYARYENGPASIRVGRLRTSFGFSDWSENFYTGFNHKPLVREAALVGHTRLDRDDNGAEATANFGQLQIQGSLLNTTPTRAQLGADKLDHATLTAQYGLGHLILGAELLSQTDGSQKIYGANFRYTIPHWLFKGEYFDGVGPNSGFGSYIDATYRIPSLTRTELVAAVDQVRVAGSEQAANLQTVGVRQIFSEYLTVNINYGWGSDLNYSSYASNLGLAGWSAQAMFQVHF